MSEQERVRERESEREREKDLSPAAVEVEGNVVPPMRVNDRLSRSILRMNQSTHSPKVNNS